MTIEVFESQAEEVAVTEELEGVAVAELDVEVVVGELELELDFPVVVVGGLLPAGLELDEEEDDEDEVAEEEEDVSEEEVLLLLLVVREVVDVDFEEVELDDVELDVVPLPFPSLTGLPWELLGKVLSDLSRHTDVEHLQPSLSVSCLSFWVIIGAEISCVRESSIGIPIHNRNCVLVGPRWLRYPGNPAPGHSQSAWLLSPDQQNSQIG